MSEVQQANGGVSDSARLGQTRLRFGRELPCPWRENGSVFNRALDHAIRWDRRSYPGLRSATLAILDGRVSWGAVRHWLSGRHPSPIWADRALAAAIKSEAIYGLQLAAELEASADRKESASSTGKRVAPGFHRWK